MYSYAWLYEAYDSVLAERARAAEERGRAQNALQAFFQRSAAEGCKDGFARIRDCRLALDTMDRMGWQRSFHQRMFHDNFIRACARIFFKTDPPGAFARAHQAVLDINGWDNASQEVLISTPRRFGKTISVSMFAAALVYSARSVEISIYSTCKRISQKLLRNVQKFLRLIYAGLKARPFKELRCNMEEVVLQGPEGPTDVRIVNSYPSKVRDLLWTRCVAGACYGHARDVDETPCLIRLGCASAVLLGLGRDVLLGLGRGVPGTLMRHRA
jgi:hypothetical protein